VDPESEWNIYVQLLFGMSWAHNANKSIRFFFLILSAILD